MQDAVLRGWFRTNRSPTSGQSDLRTVAMTALEIASAMVFLHSNNVVHGVRWHSHCLLSVWQSRLLVDCLRKGSLMVCLLRGDL